MANDAAVHAWGQDNISVVLFHPVRKVYLIIDMDAHNLITSVREYNLSELTQLANRHRDFALMLENV